jgi:hypothetical protein
MIADWRLTSASSVEPRIADYLQRREVVCAVAVLVFVGAVLMPGCITKPQNPSATQPATALDLATTQPSYWLNQPAVAQVRWDNFDEIVEVGKQVMRGYQMVPDRVDYRAGEFTTTPQISKQWFEPWRWDTGTAVEVFANSLGAIRRTLSLDVVRNPDQTFTITPKVLVEREVILERRVTDVSQYRLAFSGPGVRIQPRESVTLDPATYPDVPIKYWYPTGRDPEMGVKVAARLQKGLEQHRAMVMASAGGGGGGGGGARVNVPTTEATAAPLHSDGVVSALGPAETLSINIGVGEQVVPGMTFEVYDERATLPSVAMFGEHNPGSKGWIEVVSVANGSSTCRVVKPEGSAAPPRAGDQVFNFIFARGRQNHFGVAGDFAMAKRETLTALITRWNGVVDEVVGPQTDYLILGSAPKEEAARRGYETVRSQVEQLKVPVVSEERFNLLVRYYNPGTK